MNLYTLLSSPYIHESIHPSFFPLPPYESLVLSIFLHIYIPPSLPSLLPNFIHKSVIQVLSSSVSKAVTMIGGEEASETAMFVLMMDRFFDCFNVGKYTSGKYSRNTFKQPYRSSRDFRLNVRDCFTKYSCTFLDLLCTLYMYPWCI